MNRVHCNTRLSRRARPSATAYGTLCSKYAANMSGQAGCLQAPRLDYFLVCLNEIALAEIVEVFKRYSTFQALAGLQDVFFQVPQSLKFTWRILSVSKASIHQQHNKFV